MGPSRPANISTTRTYCAAAGSDPVTPVDNPVVANAETTSNSARSSSSSDSAITVIVPRTTSATPSSATDSACRSTPVEISRPNAVTAWSPRTSATIAKNSTMNVVSLIPPPMPPLPPPMNIRQSSTSQLVSSMAATSMELKPAERACGPPMKKPTRNLSPTASRPSVAALLHSNTVIASMPTTVNSAYAETVIFVCMVQ